MHYAMHTYLLAIRSLAQPGQQAYECARSYFIGNRGHDLNGSMPKGGKENSYAAGAAWCAIEIYLLWNHRNRSIRYNQI